MASTITNGTLKATLTENVLLNGQTFNPTNTLTVTAINEIAERNFTVVTGSETVLATFGTVRGAGAFLAADIRYIRVVNKDDTNYLRLRITKATNQTFDIKLGAGQFFVIGNTSESVSATAGAFSAFVDFTSIVAQADTADVDIQLFIACV